MTEKRAKIEEMPDILTLQQACDVLNVHPNTLRNWDKRGVLVAVRFGTRKDRRYRKEDIIRFIEKNN